MKDKEKQIEVYRKMNERLSYPFPLDGLDRVTRSRLWLFTNNMIFALRHELPLPRLEDYENIQV